MHGYLETGKPVFDCMFAVIKMWYKNIAGRFFNLWINYKAVKHACDGRTDGQNYDSQDRASIAASSASRGNNKHSRAV